MQTNPNDMKAEFHAMVRKDTALFKFLQGGAQNGICYWRIDDPHQGWISSRSWALLGYTADEEKPPPSRWLELIHPDDWQSLQQKVASRRSAPTRAIEQIMRCRYKNGFTRWIRFRALAVRKAGDPSISIVVTLADVTVQKVAEQNLTGSREFLMAVFDSIQDGISVLDRDLNIITVNRTMNQWYAHKLPLEGKKCFDVYHGRRKACLKCPTAKAMRSGRLEMDEIPLIRRGVQVGTLELFAFPMLNASGQTETVVEYVRDISARKRAEALLKERELLFRSLFEKNHSVMMLIDPQSGAIVDANPAACAFYGYPKAALLTMKITDINILAPEALFEEMEKVITDEKNHFTFSHRLADGTIREVEVFSGPIAISGRSLLCSIVHDISARKEAEREKQRWIEKLQKALSEVKTLRGFLPICSSCKKIRDDKGYWNQIESYIRNHSEAEFSHGICPDCARRLYPDLNIPDTPDG